MSNKKKQYNIDDNICIQYYEDFHGDLEIINLKKRYVIEIPFEKILKFILKEYYFKKNKDYIEDKFIDLFIDEE